MERSVGNGRKTPDNENMLGLRDNSGKWGPLTGSEEITSEPHRKTPGRPRSYILSSLLEKRRMKCLRHTCGTLKFSNLCCHGQDLTGIYPPRPSFSRGVRDVVKSASSFSVQVLCSVQRNGHWNLVCSPIIWGNFEAASGERAPLFLLRPMTSVCRAEKEKVHGTKRNDRVGK